MNMAVEFEYDQKLAITYFGKQIPIFPRINSKFDQLFFQINVCIEPESLYIFSPKLLIVFK